MKKQIIGKILKKSILVLVALVISFSSLVYGIINSIPCYADSVDLYWFPVGGTGTGNFNGGGHWATAADGTGLGHADPTSTNNVFFTSTSFTGAGQIVTVNSTANCANMDWTGATNTPTFAGNSTLNIYGSLTFIVGMTKTFSGLLNFVAITTGKTVTFNGSLVCQLGFGSTTAGGEWTIIDNLNIGTGKNINMAAGSVIFSSGISINCQNFSTNSGYSCTLTLNNATFNVTNWSLTNSCTLDSGTAVINISSNYTGYATCGTYDTLVFNGTGVQLLQGVLTCNTLTKVGGASAENILRSQILTITVSGTCTLQGNSASYVMAVASGSAGVQRTLTAGTFVVNNCSFQDIVCSGAGAPAVPTTSCQDLGNNSGITFTAHRYWVGGTGNWSDGVNHWSLTNGGGAGATPPGITDNANFTSLSNATAYTVTVDITAYCLDMAWALPGTSGVPTFIGSSSLDIYGSLTFVATMVNSYSGTITFRSTSAGKTILSAVALVCGFTFNGIGGGWTLQDALTVGNSTTLAGGSTIVTNGSLNTNNVTINTVNFNMGAGATVALGTSTINCYQWNCNASSTLTATSSTINATGTFNGTGKTYNIVNMLTNTTAPNLNGANTFSTLNITGMASMVLTVTLDSNQVVTGTFTITGNTSYNRPLIKSSVFNTPRTINCTGATTNFTDVDFQDIVISGSPTTGTNVRVGDCGGNTGQTFTAGAPKYWVALGGSWSNSTVHWSTSDGGAPDVNAYPLPQDTAYFTAGSILLGGQTITMDEPRYSGIDFSAVANTPAVTHSGSVYYFGSIDLRGLGAFTTGSTSYFSGRDNYTVRTNGKSFNTFVIWCPTGTLTLLDSMTNTGEIEPFYGTFDTGNQTIIAPSFASAGTPTVTLGSSQITLNKTDFTKWAPSAGTVFTANTATLILTSTAATAHTFAGAGINYNGMSLTIQGAGNYALTISGSNTFATLTIDRSAAAKTLKITNGTTQTVSNFVCATSGTTVLTIANTSSTTAGILQKSGGGTISLDYVNVSYNTAKPSFAWSYGAHGSAGSGVTGWVSGTPTESLYWVGNGGNWNDSTNHWAIASNGTPNAAYIPDATVSVTFDASSFSAGAQTVTVNATANCLNMDWTNVDSAPTFAGSSALNVYGNLIFVAGVTQTYTGTLTLASTTTGKTVTCGGTLACPITVNGVGGAWTLQDTMNLTAQTFTLTAGSFTTNSQALTTTGIVTISGSTLRTFNMSGSTVTCGTWTATTTTNLTYTTDASSKIIMTGNTTFNGGSLTNYKEVDLNGNGTITIDGSNTFTNLVLPSGTTQTLKITNNTTQTVGTASLSGSAGHTHTITNTSSTTPATLTKSGGGTLVFDYIALTYNTGSPATTWYYGSNSTVGAGVTGWTQYATSVAISNSASSYTLNSDAGGSGIVMPNTFYYANPLGSTTSPTVGGATDAECEWTLTNTSDGAIDLTCTMSDFSGGDSNSVNSNNGTNGVNTFGAKSYFSGQASGAWIIIKTSGSSVGYTNLPAMTNIKWGFLIKTQTNLATNGTSPSQSVIILTATAH